MPDIKDKLEGQQIMVSARVEEQDFENRRTRLSLPAGDTSVWVKWEDVRFAELVDDAGVLQEAPEAPGP